MPISNHAAAAKLIRAELKKHGISGTVRAKSYAGGSSVTVSLADELPATAALVRGFTGRFQYGHFDGMSDMYVYSNSRDDLPQVGFIFVNNSYSDEVQQAAWDWCKSYWADMEAAPASYNDAWQHRTAHGMNGRDMLNRALSGTDSGFWFARKPRLAA